MVAAAGGRGCGLGGRGHTGYTETLYFPLDVAMQLNLF